MCRRLGRESSSYSVGDETENESIQINTENLWESSFPFIVFLFQKVGGLMQPEFVSFLPIVAISAEVLF